MSNDEYIVLPPKTKGVFLTISESFQEKCLLTTKLIDSKINVYPIKKLI